MYFSLSVNRCGTQQKKANPALAQILYTPPVDLQASSLVLVDLNLTFLPPRYLQVLGVQNIRAQGRFQKGFGS